MKYKLTRFWKAGNKETTVENKGMCEMEIGYIGSLYTKIIIEDNKIEEKKEDEVLELFEAVELWHCSDNWRNGTKLQKKLWQAHHDKLKTMIHKLKGGE